MFEDFSGTAVVEASLPSFALHIDISMAAQIKLEGILQ